ncbi:hypothetical protein GBN32_00245 [Plesiomonas shigelloides]|uniref:baseplate J/gp47 family protein n=1 Tax=Plesiomonas shigelloides TaxID=703 RepID=UPI001261A9AB|nr:baseplate J/gp47 family protein [Plesiomonas shigelloides]KAB7715703.1 hypothetical protein GBN32_00245 [Plesiomonas shigelloides]
MLNGKPNADYEKILSEHGMPTSKEEIRQRFNEIVKDEGLITNTSRMSPFWRLISSIVSAPVMWLKDALVHVVMANLFLSSAEGIFVDIFAWAVNLSRKDATSAEGVILFTKNNADNAVTIPANTAIQTERINGVIYTVVTTEETVIPVGIQQMLVTVQAKEPGTGFNLAPGYYRILPNAIDGIASVENMEDWLTSPGADKESDDELRDRVRNQFNLAGAYHIDAVYRGLIASVSGISADRIYFKYDAPRGPGTANAYILLDSGIVAQPFIDTINDYIMTQGYHGHGDDVQAFAMPETKHDLSVTLYLYSTFGLSEQDTAILVRNVEHLIRCAFRENTDYHVQKTWPYSRFSMSRLAQEIHQNFSEVESVQLSLQDIESDLSVPRLQSLSIEVAQ